ncbi:peptidase domain-containing ABC transporter (plasmid) [Trichormus variabilis ARAD]|uniref:Peptidase domain-containing ABC transporter n=1 Tax=Trichormus variabilis N2B TaxID=2681315 RepID=A0ABR6SGT6_ANAVA|nr:MULTISPECIES: peptidase domain-containing ABC transporter [Nostocaceae]MBC1217824.1 peptidase domain-containing ABC transporter [Trichormus variabilis ARAD]MBC1259040.1 peptidase domain-containing ABC transporter [Trichormus variabilis V5]MBC1305612.1 peptidase domain-containing ABC transporter [Trichormus variabilis N2B]MBC1314520.1 peptidase domain-containing ABC transporter [Trichormus variabilis PNB]MBC1329876.1 peptidase domain-containing ABC transporter [Trichormus variabilis 9RC]
MKYPVVLQHNEEDCGPACLATICKYYGRLFTINRTREAAGTGQLGTTLLNLKQGAQVLGFNARGVKAVIDLVDKQQIPLPAIIHWKGNHWTVLYGRRGKQYIVADPLVGVRYLTKEALLTGWTNGVMLLLEPRPDFLSQADDQDKVGGWKRLGQRLFSYRHILAEALLLNFVVGLLALLSPFLIQILTDDVLVRGDTQLLTGIALGVLAMSLISSALQWVQGNLVAHFAHRLELDLVLEFGRIILRLPLSYYESRRSGEVVSRLRDIQTINQLVSQVGVTLPSQLLIAIASLALMLFYSPKLTLASLFIALFMPLSTVVFFPSLQQKIRNVLGIAAENQGILVETFKGALVVKTTNAAPEFWQEFQTRYGRQANFMFRTVQIVITNNIFSGWVATSGGIILLWFGSTLVINREITIGQLLAFNSLNTQIIALVNTVVGFVTEFTRAQAATERLNEVIQSTPEFPEVNHKPFVNIPDNAEIICSYLNFHHPGRVDLLQDFSLTLPGGKVIAIIGQSGCGKSTLTKLLAGLYTPQSGNIRIHRYNLQDLSPDCLRQQVILVPQEAHFWSRSILDNLRLGNPQVNFEQVVTACQVAGADTFISKLPEKYQTILGEFGANLSGGQRQRLAIARGIVTHPPILILDESTAGLDPKTESVILDQLLAYRQGKTTILISHRPHVIKRADWIVLLEAGQLQLQGTLSELLNIPGEHLDYLIS